MSMTFTKLFSSITESSIWSEDDNTRLVWVTMLAMSDKHGRVWASIPGLAHRARVPLEGCERAIEKFLAPDKYSRTTDHEGRRIEVIDGGWRMLNHLKYRQTRDEEDRRAVAAERQRRHREATGAAVTPCHALSRPVTPRHALSRDVTPCNDNAEAEAEAEVEREAAALPAPAKPRFNKPTVEAVRLHCAKIGLPEDEAEKFWHFYEAKGWKVGNSPMRNWSSALVNWRTRWQERGGVRQPGTTGGTPDWKRRNDLEAEEAKLKDITREWFDRERNPDAVRRLEAVRAELAKLKGAL